MKKSTICLIIAIILVLGLIGFVIASDLIGNDVVKTSKTTNNPVVTMELEGYGTVKIELNPKAAPNTVKNFINLVESGYYDGLTFHRAVEGFMIQGGDKEGTGSGKTEQTIKGEFLQNGYTKNSIRMDRGVIAMARADYSSLGLTEEGYNSAYSQFFILTEDTPNINGYYAGFGKVLEGMEYIDEISKIEHIQDSNKTTSSDDAQSEAIKNPTITKMTVDTFGVNYGEPERQEAFDVNSYLSQLYGFSF